MDGVFAMQPYYARSGFAFEHRELRFEWVAGAAAAALPGQPATADAAEPGPGTVTVVPLSEVPAQAVVAFDAQHFPAARPQFILPWIAQPGAIALGAVREGSLEAIAVARRCRLGRKIGPLFASSPALADILLHEVESRMPGERAQIDMPEPNDGALRIAAARGMRRVFGCAKMTLGTPPPLPLAQIFGVATFELG